MYLSLRNRPELPAAVDLPAPVLPRARIDSNVYFLGLTSMFTDISSEMVTAILPIYLTVQLNFSPAQFGAFDGLYQAVAAMAAILVGVQADRRRRYKEFAAGGYALSAGCKLGLLAAGNRWLPSTSALYLDRIGKGARTAPRDALISLSSAPSRLAESFGVHRALDTIGALAGPVVAFAVLETAPRSYDAVFVCSFFIALIGLGILVLFVRNRPPAAVDDQDGPAHRPSLRASVALLRQRRFRAVVVCGGLLGLFTLSDSFVLLTFQRRAGIDLRWFPLLFVGPSLVYIALAVPFGRLADRVGKFRVFVVGEAFLVLSYALVAAPSLGTIHLFGLFATFGAFYAATDGVLAALASDALPAAHRTSGLALTATIVTITNGIAALSYGWMWNLVGPGTVLVWFAVAIAAVAALSLPLLARVSR